MGVVRAFFCISDKEEFDGFEGQLRELGDGSDSDKLLGQLYPEIWGDSSHVEGDEECAGVAD